MNTKQLSSFIAVLTVAILGFGLLSVPQSAKAAPPISVNFQTAGAQVPNGYVLDSGAPYGNRGNGETYGWVTEATANTANPVGVDMSTYARERNYVADQRLDTIIHMQFVAPNQPNGPRGAWELAVPVGTYIVEVSVGDKPGGPNGTTYDSQHSINVEGTNAINQFQATAAQEYFTGNATVGVTDGRLTIDAIGGNNTKINYVTVTPTTTPDDDGDNVNNLVDACPNDFGTGADGCPVDTDNDGFFDHEDSCIDTAGIAPDGCPPVPPADSDNDGISDVNDVCPLVPGVAPDGCPAPVVSNPGSPAPVIVNDGRENPSHGDLIAAIYSQDDGINVYCINDSAQGFFSFRIDASTIAGFPAQPASNTLVASSPHCAVSFYILSSGQFQINIGPDAGGDVREMVFNGLGMSNLRLSNYIDRSGGNIAMPAGNSGGAARNTTATVTPLTDCRVTPLDILNFRESADPNSDVLTMIPYNYTVQAINRTGDRFNVIFGDDNGWVSASPEHVTTEGSCG